MVDISASDHLKVSTLRSVKKTLRQIVDEHRALNVGIGWNVEHGMAGTDAQAAAIRTRSGLTVTLTSAGHKVLVDRLRAERTARTALHVALLEQDGRVAHELDAALTALLVIRQAIALYLKQHPMCARCYALLVSDDPERNSEGWRLRAVPASAACPKSLNGATHLPC